MRLNNAVIIFDFDERKERKLTPRNASVGVVRIGDALRTFSADRLSKKGMD